MPGQDPMTSTFINPYTFVDLPEAVQRAAPVGHHELGQDRYSGTLEVAITARSPLLIRNVYGPSYEPPQGASEAPADGPSVGRFPQRVFPGHLEGRVVPFVPGSSIAGAVRALHELITGGCLRVFNGDFRPGYRDQAKTVGGDWRLAKVTQVDGNGRPTRVRLCDDVVWVRHQDAYDALAGDVMTGAALSVETSGAYYKLKRQLVDGGAVGRYESGEEWTILVTDTGTRQKHPGARWAAGRLGLEQQVDLDPEVWTVFQDVAYDTRDMREQRNGDDRGAITAQVTVKGAAATGRRRPATRFRSHNRLYANQVVWIRGGSTSTGAPVRIEGISLAAIWRHSGGTSTAKDRVPGDTRACTDPTALCPSCRIFGSVDAEGGEPQAEQRSYRGHVRFGDARPEKVYPLTQQFLPPLGTPNPGAGQFYLERRSKHEGRSANRKADPALREWGSDVDRGERRNFRGRKQYWLTGRHAERPYFQATEGKALRQAFHQHAGAGRGRGKMLSVAESTQSGVKFTLTVAFENLDKAELGSLIVALDPGSLLTSSGQGDPAEYGWGLGGGRPLGFGTVVADVVVGTIETAGSRYRGAEPPTWENGPLQDAVSAFVESASITDEHLNRLAAVLRLDRAAPGLVWYPPIQGLAEDAAGVKPAELAPNFTFWRKSAGAYEEHGGNKFRQLPEATDDDLTMDIDPMKGPK
jgi:CRISPR-associated protein (TIGR03986 family)